MDIPAETASPRTAIGLSFEVPTSSRSGLESWRTAHFLLGAMGVN
jgi:hypothetical protein